MREYITFFVRSFYVSFESMLVFSLLPLHLGYDAAAPGGFLRYWRVFVSQTNTKRLHVHKSGVGAVIILQYYVLN